jgi:hypothetical protein
MKRVDRLEIAANYAREYILARTNKVRRGYAEEFLADVEYILGDAVPTANAGIPTLKALLSRPKRLHRGVQSQRKENRMKTHILKPTDNVIIAWTDADGPSEFVLSHLHVSLSDRLAALLSGTGDWGAMYVENENGERFLYGSADPQHRAAARKAVADGDYR